MRLRVLLACLVSMAFPAMLPSDVPVSKLALEFMARVPVTGSGEFVTFVTQTPIPMDDRLLIGTRRGRVYIMQPDGTLPVTPFLNISTFSSDLYSLAFHPNFGDSCWFFYILHTGPAGQPVLSRFEMLESDRSIVRTPSRRVLFSIDEVGSSGDRGAKSMAFGPDGYLYIAIGEGGGANDPFCNSQNMATMMGKMLRIDVDQNIDESPWYGIPPDNPFLDDPLVPDEIYLVGFRNPIGFHIDRETGDMWIPDEAQHLREELNHLIPPIQAPLNFGWPVREGDIENPGLQTFSIPYCNAQGITLPASDYDGFHEPIHVFDKTMSGDWGIRGGRVYRGSRMPGLYGLYLFGERATGRIWIMDPSDYSVTEELVLGQGIGNGLNAFGEDRQGELYVGHGRDVYKLVPEYTDRFMIR